MAKKAKFKPEITRIKLNPEQAVLACACYSGGHAQDATGYRYTGVSETICWGTRTRGSGSLCYRSGTPKITYRNVPGASSS